MEMNPCQFRENWKICEKRCLTEKRKKRETEQKKALSVGFNKNKKRIIKWWSRKV